MTSQYQPPIIGIQLPSNRHCWLSMILQHLYANLKCMMVCTAWNMLRSPDRIRSCFMHTINVFAPTEQSCQFKTLERKDTAHYSDSMLGAGTNWSPIDEPTDIYTPVCPHSTLVAAVCHLEFSREIPARCDRDKWLLGKIECTRSC